MGVNVFHLYTPTPLSHYLKNNSMPRDVFASIGNPNSLYIRPGKPRVTVQTSFLYIDIGWLLLVMSLQVGTPLPP